jgi:D-glycero-D-manno-heptose 1,7-bisphosphate phosphatase
MAPDYEREFPADRRVRATPRALFLDRDGTLVRDTHYLCRVEDVEVLAGVREALTLALETGWTLYLFTNQSGVGRGMFPLEAVHRVNARMLALLGLGDALFRRVCIAPEAPGGPVRYRKPSPRFILETLEADGLDPAQCWMVGDSASDYQAGLAAGVRGALVATGRGGPGRASAEGAADGVRVHPDLLAFVRAELL